MGEARRGLTRREKKLPLQGGGRSCACFASYKCGEGAHPVRETLETFYPSPEFLSSVVAKKFIPLPQGARGCNRHSEGLAEESQCLLANAFNFALTPPQWGRLGGGQPTQQDKNGGVAC